MNALLSLGKATLVGLAVIVAVTVLILFVLANAYAIGWVSYNLSEVLAMRRGDIQALTTLALTLFWSGFFGYFYVTKVASYITSYIKNSY